MDGNIIKAFVFISKRKLKNEIFSGHSHCFRISSHSKQKEKKDLRVFCAAQLSARFLFNKRLLAFNNFTTMPLSGEKIKKSNNCQLWYARFTKFLKGERNHKQELFSVRIHNYFDPFSSSPHSLPCGFDDALLFIRPAPNHQTLVALFRTSAKARNSHGKAFFICYQRLIRCEDSFSQQISYIRDIVPYGLTFSRTR